MLLSNGLWSCLDWSLGSFLAEQRFLLLARLRGCFAYEMMIDGEFKPACATAVNDGMVITLDLSKNFVPLGCARSRNHGTMHGWPIAAMAAALCVQLKNLDIT